MKAVLLMLAIAPTARAEYQRLVQKEARDKELTMARRQFYHERFKRRGCDKLGDGVFGDLAKIECGNRP